MSFEARVSVSTSADRASLWFVGVVLALTTAMSAQTVWWMWHPPLEHDRSSSWSMLRIIAAAIKGYGWRGPLVGGGILMALAAGGVARRRLWGLALALPCSALLCSATLIARHIALSEGPREYVPRSPYVQTTTGLALVVLASHGAAALLGFRLLWRQPPASPTAPLRGAMSLLAFPTAAVLLLWLDDGRSQAAAVQLIVLAAAAAVLAVLAAAIRPRRATLRAAIATCAAALALQAACVAHLLVQRPHPWRFYSETAQEGLPMVAATAPALLIFLGLCLLLRRRATPRHADP